MATNLMRQSGFFFFKVLRHYLMYKKDLILLVSHADSFGFSFLFEKELIRKNVLILPKFKCKKKAYTPSAAIVY